MTQDFIARVHQAVKELPVPQPDDRLLRRILADRTQGLDVPLPGPRRSIFSRHALLLSFGCAAALVLWVLGDRQDAALPPVSFWPDQLYAQGQPSPRLDPIRPIDGTSIKPGVWVRRVRVFDEDGGTRESFDSVTIGRGTMGTEPVWIVTRARPGGRADTSWFSIERMHPLAAHATLLYGASLVHTFTGDSLVRIWTKSDGQVERVSAPLETPRLWDSAVMLPMNERFLLFLGRHLGASWEGSYVGTAIANTHERVTFWWELKVIGEERITVEAGSFDCWKIAQVGERLPDLITWVDKRSGWIIREGLTNGRYERVLVRHTDR